MMPRAAACLALLLVLSSAWAQGTRQERPRHELIYGSELMSAEEREQYRRDARAAADAQAQAKLRTRQRERMRERAQQRGVQLVDPQGIVRR